MRLQRNPQRCALTSTSSVRPLYSTHEYSSPLFYKPSHDETLCTYIHKVPELYMVSAFAIYAIQRSILQNFKLSPTIFAAVQQRLMYFTTSLYSHTPPYSNCMSCCHKMYLYLSALFKYTHFPHKMSKSCNQNAVILPLRHWGMVARSNCILLIQK